MTAYGTVHSERRFSTNVVPPAARLGFWNDISTRLFGAIRIDSRTQAPFHGEIIRLPLRDCELLSIRSSPASLIRPSTADGQVPAEDMLTLKLVCSGHATSVVAGREVALRPGDFLLMNASASDSYSFDEPLHVIVLLLHARRLEHRMRQLQPYLNQRIRAESGGPAILAAFLRSAWQSLQEGFRAEWSAPLSDTVWSLFDVAFPDQGGVVKSPARRPERLRAAQRLIDAKLCNPDFHVGDIADALHVSERYVQSLFTDLDTTPSRYLLGRRLELAAQRLRQEPAMRIGEVALSVGFNDLAYFSRAFHKRFGMSARTFRALSAPAAELSRPQR